MNILKKIKSKINLKLFADLNPNGTYSPGLSAEMKTYYSDYLIDLVDPLLIHDQFAQKKDIPANGGTKIEFRKFLPLPKATKPIQEGVTPKGNTYSVTTITSQVYQYGDYLTLTDILQLAAIDNNVVEATKLISSQAGRTLDTVTREVINGGTNVIYAPTADEPDTEVTGRHLLTSNNKFTADMAFQAKTQLGAFNAPKVDDSYVAIIHPYAAYDLMRDPEWLSVKQYDSADYYKGEIGKIGGIRFVESSEAKIFRGEDLASDSRTLKVSSASGTTVNFKGGTVEADSLAGRFVLIDGNKYQVESNTTSAMTLTETVTASADTVIYPGEGGAEGCAVFSVLVVGANAYATTSITGGGLQHIVKPLGSGGTADPLNQRSTVGWKATKAAERLVEEYMVRVECGSKYSNKALAN